MIGAGRLLPAVLIKLPVDLGCALGKSGADCVRSGEFDGIKLDEAVSKAARFKGNRQTRGLWVIPWFDLRLKGDCQRLAGLEAEGDLLLPQFPPRHILPDQFPLHGHTEA